MTPGNTTPRYAIVQSAVGGADPDLMAQIMLPLMLRNVSSELFRFEDPADPAKESAPGCVIAAPSTGTNLPSVKQDYVYAWVRDAAVVAGEIALGDPPGRDDRLREYIRFSRLCQANAESAGHVARAAFTIEGDPRAWSDQSDGAALQTLAVMTAWDDLDDTTRAVARDLVARNVAFLLDAHAGPTVDLWETWHGYSLFTRSVQLRCLKAVRGTEFAPADTPRLDAAIADLTGVLTDDDHWDAARNHLISMIGDTQPGYEPNISSVMAAVYGALEVTDTRVLATVAALRAAWTGGPDAYPVNAADAALGLGPMFGRFPGDTYDGDDNDSGTGHPWALCTANVAEVHYDLAAAVASTGRIPIDDRSRLFFDQLGIGATTTIADVAAILCDAGDRMLGALIRHSDHLELSEQFDAATGYEKSVRNLTWSYAAYLSAVRARRRALSTPLPTV
ncbi:MAG: hypothetical protein J0I34_17980 [Pseudonocardia sp.]|uniref:glycoside hydrolase family 15 protein n=1 Tax=unclassified Pseudonocardia TaxID=2619320 RepID=UPI001AD3968D|nr:MULTISPECIES: glycoside hydrolase family 15 protein [unclassified Pseudonocardia]MBN9110655.1 hypothetical protein [Pseudonocardia sp.]